MFRPRPKPKPKPQPQPGILGEKGYSKFGKMKYQVKQREFYKPIPGYGRKFTAKEREGLIQDLKKYSGQTHGLSTGTFSQAIKKMKEEKRRAGLNRDFSKAKELDQKIKQAEAWKKG